MKKKLSLNTIKVRSFITTLENTKAANIKGGDPQPTTNDTANKTICEDPGYTQLFFCTYSGNDSCNTANDTKCVTMDANCSGGVTADVKCVQ